MEGGGGREREREKWGGGGEGKDRYPTFAPNCFYRHICPLSSTEMFVVVCQGQTVPPSQYDYAVRQIVRSLWWESETVHR